MFKKKSKETVQEVKKTEVLSKPKLYHEWQIEEAIDILNDAIATGQLPYHNYNSLPIVNTHICVYTVNSYHDKIENGYISCNTAYDCLRVVQKQDIKSQVLLDNENRKKKQEQLDRLREVQAQAVSDIEKLAKELGEI